MNALKQMSEVTGVVTIESGLATLADGTTIDLQAALAKQEELLAALRDALHAFQSGDCYETQNPYTRPYVKRGLLAIKDFTAFSGDWANANPLPISAE